MFYAEIRCHSTKSAEDPLQNRPTGQNQNKSIYTLSWQLAQAVQRERRKHPGAANVIRYMIMRTIGVVLLAYGFRFGQATLFEVASIKPAAPVEFGRTSVRRSVTKEKGTRGRLNYQGIP
jgi:hypothetical protein